MRTRGALLMISSALAFSVMTVLVKLAGERLPSQEIVFYFPLVTVPAVLPTIATSFVWPQGIEWVWLIGVGLTTQIGQVCLTRGLTRLPAAEGTAFSYLQVVFAAIWGLLVFGERPDHLTLMGGGLVIAGAVWLARERSSGARRPGRRPGTIEQREPCRERVSSPRL